MNKLKAVLLTREAPRHIYFANLLNQHVNLAYVGVHDRKESSFFKALKHKKISRKLSEVWKVLTKWIFCRSLQEKFFFFGSSPARFDDSYTVQKFFNINDKDFVKKINDLNPDIIFTFGCGVLKNKNYFHEKRKILNLHSGLIPDYRGVDSVYWCIYNNEFHNIGYTIHFIDKRLDMGEIVAAARIDAAAIKTESQTFFCVIKSAIQRYPEIINNIMFADDLLLSKPKNSGKMYYERDRNLYTDMVVFFNLMCYRVGV